ncbi:hypoxanthine phosphoribosyltransferase [Mucilaginibacter polytrichastri]|uniref:Hypoxanthine phosphoribosyltransferase n=1 Tax=Mucilaginibacter polytrichastri TaxID=1302689 RepID=A0A1Q6A4R5_9SPHI|nr:hypoxanthine phosphoribosyltransferase [Mucilaginibacter polytrichastri]OKS88987.1 Hypoxanthine-guanine phosphoribosyltransferase [Mucilaginibacter polytrichastri]SFS95148.1 hypoxanthine phosphoribosyltransferase [Mucilaginibacter polytrichastri]
MNVKVVDLEFEPLITHEAIQKRLAVLGEQISKEYDGKLPVFLGVLNGSFLFIADLIRLIDIPCEVTFTKLASYFGGTASSRTVRNDIDLGVDIQGRHVIIVEDIIDSGNTLAYLIERLKVFKPASLKVCTLLSKTTAIEIFIQELAYVGFEIEKEFVVGYGLDYKEQGRNLKDIYRLVSA